MSNHLAFLAAEEDWHVTSPILAIETLDSET